MKGDCPSRGREQVTRSPQCLLTEGWINCKGPATTREDPDVCDQAEGTQLASSEHSGRGEEDQEPEGQLWRRKNTDSGTHSFRLQAHQLFFCYFFLPFLSPQASFTGSLRLQLQHTGNNGGGRTGDRAQSRAGARACDKPEQNYLIPELPHSSSVN